MNLYAAIIALAVIYSGRTVGAVLGAPTRDENNENFSQRKLNSCSASDYKIPDGMESKNLFNTIVRAIGADVNLSETPIVIRIFSLIDGSLWNCVAAYDTHYLDAFRRKQRPVVEVPPTVCRGEVNPHTTEPRAQCLVNVYAAAIPYIVPDAVEAFQGAIETLNAGEKVTEKYPTPFPMGLHADIQACQTKQRYPEFKKCLRDTSSKHEYTPDVVASAIVADMLHYATNSGWNMDGTENQCEYNCQPYADMIGYTPRNLNYSGRPQGVKTQNRYDGSGDIRPRNGRPRRNMGNDKYKKHWQPLLESDGRGFFYRQEHVTPHIGFTAHPRLFTRQEIDKKVIPDPRYDLVKEARLVTERLKNLDDEIKIQIQHFDNKSLVAGTLYVGLIQRYGDAFTFERIMLWLASFLSAEEDAVILAWKEKVRHDLVRPTTVIQQSSRYGTPEQITTWAGPYQSVETFASKEFQPYIRVMPHAEYPSGSACICQAGESAMKAYMKHVFRDDAQNFTPSRTFSPRSSIVEPDTVPAQEVTLQFSSLEDFRLRCGQSRLDGGMHFTASVPQGYKLCQGFEPKVKEFIFELLNGKNELITTYTPP